MKKGKIVKNEIEMIREKKIAAKQELQLEGITDETKKRIVIAANKRKYLAITQDWVMNRI
ncbi:hypothetical protein FO495_28825 [Bacillus tropicus]|nr:hypothetical protein [Bacillus tropicus]